MTAFEAGDFAGFLDDAAVFPPGNAPVAQAVGEHLARRARPESVLVGPLVLTPAQLADTASALPPITPDGGPLRLALVVRDLTALPGAVATVDADPRLHLAALEIAHPDVDAVTAATSAAAPGPTVWVEPGWGPGLPAATGAIRRAGHGLKLRTGGTTAGDFPDETTLAEAVTRAVELGVRFKATAGLHHAVRHTDPVTGAEHHGFANLLLAAAAAEAGAALARTWLAERDPATVADALTELGRAGLAAVRRDRFVSFGTCDVADPRTDLTRLGLLPLDLTPTGPTVGRVTR